MLQGNAIKSFITDIKNILRVTFPRVDEESIMVPGSLGHTRNKQTDLLHQLFPHIEPRIPKEWDLVCVIKRKKSRRFVA